MELREDCTHDNCMLILPFCSVHHIKQYEFAVKLEFRGFVSEQTTIDAFQVYADNAFSIDRSRLIAMNTHYFSSACSLRHDLLWTDSAILIFLRIPWA